MLLFFQNAQQQGAAGLGEGVGGGDAAPTLCVPALGEGVGGGNVTITVAPLVERNVDRPLLLVAA